MNAKLAMIPCALILCAMLLFSTLFSVSPAFAETGAVNKDETVYGFLGADGSVGDVRVVNRLILPDGGTWVDRGSYLSVRAMETDLAPEFSPGRVVWDLSGSKGRDFYYEGVMNQALPLKAEAGWKLDGTPVKAESLSGASGSLEWTLSLAPDEGLQKNLRDGFLTQIQLSLDLDKASFLEAKDATVTVTGHMATIVWTLMPGKSGTFAWKAKVTDFAMESVTISLVKYSNPVAADVAKLTDGVTKMEDAGTKLADGTDELATGLGSLNDGITEFSAGLARLAKGSADLTTGLGDYAVGMGSFGNGLMDASNGLAKVSAGFAGLRDSASLLLAGQTALLAGMRETAAGHAKLVQLANALAASEDPMVRQLAGGVIAEQAGLDKLTGGLEQQVAGLTQYAAGLGKAIDGLNATVLGIQGLPAAIADMRAGFAKLQAGSLQLQEGVEASAEGAGVLKGKTSAMPAGAKKLADGQRELTAGLTTLKEQTSGLIPSASDSSGMVISYADGMTAIHSLQYVLRMQGVPEADKPAADGPRQIRIPWYEELWNRVTGLFNV
jgi:putative membrane protein